ncbi:DNA-3-methyladenine glycosylase family protein [Dyadobacter psychrotolerans]|uniref:DNA-3-methyladenine glycosylase II n=1 Tax=Dyadobacter psychrotolerans TaxID=2541721 RepID=A0A4R5DC55_9BACT|nr:DNA glycosylase [Dyadobacter psychrotolerans]TDE11302.1 DNA-3-methyladenine glycosylase 2 family protein [Dyadobacter psychrotolerans]
MNINTQLVSVDNTFSFEECLWFLNRNFDDCLHEIKHDYIRKALLVEGKPVLIEIKKHLNGLVVEMLSGTPAPSGETYIREYVTEWLDLDRDLQPFYKLLANHAVLGYMPEKYAGLRLIGIPDLFEALVWSIIGQQINLTFAYKIKRRLVEAYGESIRFENKLYHIFPTSKSLANTEIQDLRQMQFSGKKADYLIGLAQLFDAGLMNKTRLAKLPDLSSRQKALTDIRGIGIWTANYALMKSLKETSSIPHGDAGLLNALKAHRIIEQKTDTESISYLFSGFSGWESYLVFYLWRSLAPTENEKLHSDINSI